MVQSVCFPSFAQKAQARFKSVVERSKILVLATHDESVIESVCTRAIVLSGGKVAFDGPAPDAVAFYKASIV